MNVASLLRAGTARAEGRAAWVHVDRSVGYPELEDRVSRLAAGLAGHGLRAGDRVVITTPNRPELVEMLWACFWGAFVAVPVNWHLHPSEIEYVLRQSSAAALLVAPETADVLDIAPPGLLVVAAGPPDRRAVAYEQVLAPTGGPARDVAPDAPAWLFYTSGTTGRPKGATLTHRNLTAMTMNYYAGVEPPAGDVVHLHAAPLSHGSGLYLLPATAQGATQVIYPGATFDPETCLRLVAEARVTHLTFLSPTMLNRLVRHLRAQPRPLPTLRSVVVGGAPLYAQDADAARSVLGPVVAQIYGQGEAPMTIAGRTRDDIAGGTSVGRPFVGVEVRVVDDRSVPLPVGSTGEITVRGDVVMTGYWQDPEATRSALRDGWLHTGDVGHLDGEGRLHLTGRARDVVITGGSNVYPREVEEVLLKHPSVAEAAVVGRPDAEWGEAVVAFVVASAGAGADPEALTEHCLRHLASFKKPREYVVVPELPKNATGKVVKDRLAPPVRPRRVP